MNTANGAARQWCVCVCVVGRCSKWTYVDCQSSRRQTAPVIASSCSTETRTRLCPSRCAAASPRQKLSPAVLPSSSFNSSPTKVDLTPDSCSDTRSSKVNQINPTWTTAQTRRDRQARNVCMDFTSYCTRCRVNQPLSLT